MAILHKCRYFALILLRSIVINNLEIKKKEDHTSTRVGTRVMIRLIQLQGTQAFESTHTDCYPESIETKIVRIKSTAIMRTNQMLKKN